MTKEGSKNDNNKAAMSKTTPEKSPKKMKKHKRRATIEEDPNGSLEIARGNITKKQAMEAKEAAWEGRSESEQALIQSHLDGPNAFQGNQRLEMLQRDDANMKLDNLRDAQKRALAKRQRQKNNKIQQAAEHRRETKRLQAAVAAADSQLILETHNVGLVEAEHDMERTTGLTQVQLKRDHLNEQASQNIYDLRLDHYAPYLLKYDRSGRHALLVGQRQGHVSLMDCQERNLVTEFHLQHGECIRDACFLHNASLFAVAQRNHVYIYDNKGAEIHTLSDHNDPFRMDFLPYHWLLASVGRAGWLKYQDTSTGQLVSQHRTKLGPSQVMRHNPSNAVMHLGHKNGTVTLWSPASSTYLAKIHCHKGSPITSMAVKNHTLVTGGADGQVRIWDLRMYQETHAYYTAAGIPTSLDISQRNLLGIGHAGHATIWSARALQSKVSDPYMHHALPGCSPVESLRFRPYQDVCGIGHAKGIASIVIPGSGEPNLDSTEYGTNPHSDTKQRHEQEVRALMDKLSPDMIGLDPDVVGTMEASDPHLRQERLQELQQDANEKKMLLDSKKKKKNKKRGRSKIQTQLRRKAHNVVDEATLKLREARDAERAEREKKKEAGTDAGEAVSSSAKDSAPAALKRFFS